MSRLSGQRVQLGTAFRLDPNEDKQKEVVHEILLEAQSKAFSIVEQARNQAAQVLNNAQQQAKQLVQDAENQREEIMQQAYQTGETSGYEKGYADGNQKAEEETVQLLSGANTILDGAYQAREKVLKSFRQSAGEVIRHLTERILHQALKADPQLLYTMVDSAIDSLHLTGRIRVVVSRDTLEVIRRFNAQTEKALAETPRFDFVADPNLGGDEIFVLSDDGNFTLTPEAQVTQLLAPIIKMLPVNEADPEAAETADAAPPGEDFDPDA